ncbi:CG9305 [Drosophila busckii]|uniref:CG9305 n=1 Tax=Drosophila busckii TaxID=30019 RepID=A0A0M4E9S8_DROBS|nr:CG9305 [Drosophila busckii]
MSLRRQRIKAAANLTLVKRKQRKEDVPEAAVEQLPIPEPEPLPVASPQAKQDDDTTEVAFKRPATSGAVQLDDVFHSDIEDNVIQMDLQKTTSGFPMSPSKAQARQRVRPTPVFGQRRNSFVGSPLAADYDGDYQSPGTPTRRERYLSGSSSMGGSTTQQPHPSPKYFGSSVMSPGMGRIRTESSCSAFSDSGGVGGKQRKGDGEKSQSLAQQRVNAKRDFETRFNKGVPDKSTFKMFDMIFYNPDSNPMEQKPLVTTIKAETSSNADESKPTGAELLETKAEPAGAMPVPQLKLDANGEMIIDEKTLEIETTAEVEARKVLANSSLILMDETTGDNGFYKRHKRSPTWSAEDTVRFYRSLQTIGTDFSLMVQMFPKRTRRDLKLKYKREERVNGALINKALLYPKAFNIQELKDQLEAEDREREEANRRWQEIVAAQAENAKKRNKCQQSKAARSLCDGDLIYDNEHITKQRFGKHALAKRRADLDSQLSTDSDAVVKRRRRPLKQQQQELRDAAGKLQERADIKREAIKTEQIVSKPVEETTGEQLQQELNTLLEEGQPEFIVGLPGIDMDIEQHKTAKVVNPETEPNSFSVEFIGKPELIAEPFPEAAATPNSADALSEHDIEQILQELAEGSMVLVSSLDAEHEIRVINEIYMYDKSTGELCDEPMKIPEHIVQSILDVMS